MEADYSKDGLFRFIDTAQRQGLFNPNTAGGLRSAAARLLEDVANTDDVRHIDVEAATIKYHNKHPGDLTPGSLRTYENRMNRLLGEFVKYNQNPANYKPRSRGLPRANGERPARSEAKRKSTATGTGAEVRSATSAEAVPAATEAPTSTPALAMSYPLRENFVAQVVLPRNLSTDEARKLCAFIRTLAVDFKPEN